MQGPTLGVHFSERMFVLQRCLLRESDRIPKGKVNPHSYTELSSKENEREPSALNL